MREEKKINYHDTDAIGIVYHASYLNFLEEVRTRFLEEKGIPVKDMHENGQYFVVKSFKVDYKHPARYGDTIICRTKLDKITLAQLYFSQTILNKRNKEVLVESQMILVVVNNNLEPVLLPEEVNSALYEEMEV